MPISLGFWEWGCPKREDAHITVTASCSYSLQRLKMFQLAIACNFHVSLLELGSAVRVGML